MNGAPNCRGSFIEGTACGDCQRCEAEAETLVKEALANSHKRDERLKQKVKPCPNCGSVQIQVHIDFYNPDRDLAKCRECKYKASLKDWNNRKDA